MKTYLLSLFLALVAMQRQTPPQPAPLDAEHCKCSIEVIVKRTATGEPIPDVELQLKVATLASQRIPVEYVPIYRDGPMSVRTSAAGRAEFRDLAEGLYTVVAQRQGDFFFEGFASGSTLSSVYVGPREKLIQQVVFTMMTGGNVNGRILDSNRQPVRTGVAAFKVEYHNGQRSLATASVAEETNGLGEYRLTRLSAGEYYIRTVSSEPQQNQTYYPGVLGPSSAVRVAVQEGQELSAMDFAIPSQMGVTISGIIVNTFPGGDRQQDGKLLRTISSLYLVPRNTEFYFDFPQAVPNRAKGISNTGNGTEFPFEIHDVPPGAYDLYPLFVDTATDTRVNRYMSPTRIEVGTEDMRNITAVVRKGTALTVRVSRESSAFPPTRATIEVPPLGIGLTPKDSMPAPFFSGRNEIGVSVKPNGENSTPAVMDGRYFVSIQGSGFLPNDYVSDIRQGTKSVFDDGFITLSSDTSDLLEVIVRSGGGTIQGRINRNGQNKSPSPVTVTLVPDPPRRQNLMLYKSTSFSPDGNANFNFTGLAPGTYKVFAWENLPRGAEQNAEFMSEYETRGISVTISAGLTLINIEVPVIPVR